jgi:hypothetical protein
VTTALQAARARLEAWIAEVVLRHEDLDVVKLRRLEDEVVSAARVHDVSAPF